LFLPFLSGRLLLHQHDINRLLILLGVNIMAKTASFAVLHFSVAFSVGYALTGSALVGGTIALVEPAINTVVFFFHEKAWGKIDAYKADLEIVFANQV
jgi:uncharacterized membrane protein